MAEEEKCLECGKVPYPHTGMAYIISRKGIFRKVDTKDKVYKTLLKHEIENMLKGIMTYRHFEYDTWCEGKPISIESL